MEYNAPPGSQDPNAPYVNGIPGVQKGSPVNANAVEYPQREILNVITAAGLTPTNNELDQLLQAIELIIQAAIPPAPEAPNVYEIGEIYGFRHPTLRPGFQLAYGGLLASADIVCPKLYEYLQTPAGQLLCVSETSWQSMLTTAGGVGGVWWYVLNTSAKTIRLPDVRGDYEEFAGYDGLAVGGWHKDAIREITGQISTPRGAFVTSSAVGALYGDTEVADWGTPGGSLRSTVLRFKASNTVPTANKNQPRAGGKLPCVYVGEIS